jgi:Ca2+-binding RTX toxin-like protein
VGAYELARCLGGIVNRVGTPGNNTMRGGASAEVFLTLGGNDTVIAGGGNDRLCLGAGNDTAKIRSGGKDRAAGEGGRDRVQRDATDVVSGFEVFF